MQVVEIITFKAIAGVSHDEVVAVNKLALSEIEKIEGFEYRSLSFDAVSNTWTDIIYWRDRAALKAAEVVFMSSAACKKLMDIIEKESTDMKVSDILYSTCTEAENCG
ncbi:hypothetical protein [Pseudocolwellia agarivorans]|uniref:hypothetical protein n=1 Tax=Pseudocolwellia agarivorans TaxID=1911682 RepID=UPI0009843409|nr:hypothetical protein [Pseudocolwellia agarivorans]